MLDIALSADARNALRAEIVTHPDWCTYRRANSLSLASMTRAEYIETAQALGIDVARIAAAYGTGRQPQHRAEPRRISVEPTTKVSSWPTMDAFVAKHAVVAKAADDPAVHRARADANFPNSPLTRGHRKTVAAIALLRRLGYDWSDSSDRWVKIEW